MPQRKEKKLEHALRKVLEIQYKCHTEKLHGNMFQAGLPDLLIVWPDGQIMLIEIKRGGLQNPYDIVDKLTGRQRGVIFKLGARRTPVFVVGQKEEGDVWIFDARQLSHSFSKPENWNASHHLTVEEAAIYLQKVRNQNA